MTQILASAMSKTEKKEITIGQLVRYNDMLLKRIPDYYGSIDLDELAFEISSVAREFRLITNEDYERVIVLSGESDFDYNIYKKTFAKGIAEILDEISFSV